MTDSGLAEAAAPRVPHFYGLYRGTVVINVDPLQLSRVLVQVPAVSELELYWAQACLPPGVSTVPDVGQQVWVMFEGGDPQLPVWMGVIPSQV
jgi:hypothetical protein